MFLFLTLSITDACYGNLPAGSETPVLRASGQLSWTNIITSAAHVNSEWLIVFTPSHFLGSSSTLLVLKEEWDWKEAPSVPIRGIEVNSAVNKEKSPELKKKKKKKCLANLREILFS